MVPILMFELLIAIVYCLLRSICRCCIDWQDLLNPDQKMLRESFKIH